MTRLFAFVFALVFMAMISTSYAGTTVDLNGLSESALAELALKAAQYRKDAITSPSMLPNAKQVAEYATIGEAVGKALASTARELGVEVNNFANTKVGVIALVLIIWHFFGGMAVHVMFGATWLTVAGSAWIYFFKRLYMKRTVKFDENGKKAEVNYASVEDRDGGLLFGAVVILAVIVGVGVTATFTF